MSDVFFHFSVAMPSSGSNRAYSVTLNDSIIICSVIYLDSKVVVDDSLPDLTFTGNAEDGNISFTLHNISTARAGYYRLAEDIGTTIQCVTMYVLGEQCKQELRSEEQVTREIFLPWTPAPICAHH